MALRDLSRLNGKVWGTPGSLLSEGQCRMRPFRLWRQLADSGLAALQCGIVYLSRSFRKVHSGGGRPISNTYPFPGLPGAAQEQQRFRPGHPHIEGLKRPGFSGGSYL